ncbi:MAG: hypothetical protein KF810_20685 [Rhizobiaceae bacterium]|nr:hypothetical protein [Rhizobiaceae bacterium]
MHVTTRLRAANDAAKEAAVATAMRDLEDDVCSLLNMARILGDLLDGDLVSYEGDKKISIPEPGGVMTVHLGYEQVECLSFAWNDVIKRALHLKAKFYEAFDAEVTS